MKLVLGPFKDFDLIREGLDGHGVIGARTRGIKHSDPILQNFHPYRPSLE